MLSAMSLTPASLELHCQDELDSVRHTLTAKWRWGNMVAGVFDCYPIAICTLSVLYPTSSLVRENLEVTSSVWRFYWRKSE